MKSEKINYQIMSLPVRVLRVDLYQKKLRKRVIDGIVSNFDPVALGLIHVSLRSDGSYWIFDGQHRVEALKIMGVETVDCLVFTGLTREQEAKGFVGHHNVSKPTKIEEHNGKLMANDEKAKQIEDSLSGLGLRIIAGGGKNTVQSVATLYQIYDKYGKKMLIDVLAVVKEGFKNEKSPFRPPVLKSIAEILDEHGSKVDKNWLIRRMSQFGYDDVNNKADAFIKVYDFNKVEGMKMAITQCYNHRKSERLKLK